MSDVDSSTSILTPADVEALIARQEALESSAVEWGRENFRKRVEKAKQRGEATVAGAARKVLQDDMEKLIAVPAGAPGELRGEAWSEAPRCEDDDDGRVLIGRPSSRRSACWIISLRR
jgi:hypothetical protein